METRNKEFWTLSRCVEERRVGFSLLERHQWRAAGSRGPSTPQTPVGMTQKNSPIEMTHKNSGRDDTKNMTLSLVVLTSLWMRAKK
jgi:hypothetical protein